MALTVTGTHRRSSSLLLVALAACLLAPAAGCDEGARDGAPAAGSEAPWQPPTSPIVVPRDTPRQAPQEERFVYDPQARYEAVVHTTEGVFRIRFYDQEAPNTVRNFVSLAAAWHFYDGLIFHRIVPGETIQTGDPDGIGVGGMDRRYYGPDVAISGSDLNEVTDRPFKRGTVGLAWARGNPRSGESQWFVCLKRLPQIDGRRTAFGVVTEGMDVVDRIGQAEIEGDRAVHPSRRYQPVRPAPRIERIEIIRLEAGQRV